MRIPAPSAGRWVGAGCAAAWLRRAGRTRRASLAHDVRVGVRPSSATKPRPQASCSLDGSYRPCAAGSPARISRKLIYSEGDGGSRQGRRASAESAEVEPKLRVKRRSTWENAA